MPSTRYNDTDERGVIVLKAKLYLGLPVLFLSLVMFSACESSNDVLQNPAKSQPTNQQSNSNTGSTQFSEKETRDKPSDSKKTIDPVTNAKQNLKIGMTKADVRQLIGEIFKEIKADDSNIIWRYDFTKEGYKFEAKGLPDDVDLDGLRKGSMKDQFFLYWTGEKLSGYVLYYLTEQGKIEEYRMFENGDINIKLI